MLEIVWYKVGLSSTTYHKSLKNLASILLVSDWEHYLRVLKNPNYKTVLRVSLPKFQNIVVHLSTHLFFFLEF